MNKTELKKIIARHQHWIKQDCKDWEKMKADLSGAKLSGADLHGAKLSGADLSRADLSEAQLVSTDLSGADLHEAQLVSTNLRQANLTGAIMDDAILTGAYLTGAIMEDASLTGADLSCANLRGADLSFAILDHADIYTAILDRKDEIRKGVVLKKAIKGYKMTAEGIVITAEIPAGAVVYSINGNKCRTNMATITNMAGHKVLHSRFNSEFTYRLGKKIIITDFDTRYNVECGAGFHFFRTKKEAKAY